MALLSKDSGGGKDFEPVPAGTHVARCITVVDLGLQKTTYMGEDKWNNKVWNAWEIPAVRVKWEKDGVKHEGPAIIGSKYTNSINERAILGQHLMNWRGRAFTDAERKGFDLFTILDKECILTVTHKEVNGKVYANVTGISGLPPGIVCPPLEGSILAYSPHDTEKAGNFSKLPEWMQKMCTEGHQLDQPASNPPPTVPGNNVPEGYGDIPPTPPIEAYGSDDVVDDFDTDSIPF